MRLLIMLGNCFVINIYGLNSTILDNIFIKKTRYFIFKKMFRSYFEHRQLNKSISVLQYHNFCNWGIGDWTQLRDEAKKWVTSLVY